MVRKSTHLQVIPQQNTQNAGNLPLQTCEKNQWTFFVVRYITLSPAIILSTQVPLQKFLFLLVCNSLVCISGSESDTILAGIKQGLVGQLCSVFYLFASLTSNSYWTLCPIGP